MYCENPHARYVVERTAQLWLHIPISFETAKEEDLKPMTTDALPFVLPAMLILTKANRSPRLNVLRYGKKHTAKLLAGYLKTTK
jgi:hypothetical protein